MQYRAQQLLFLHSHGTSRSIRVHPQQWFIQILHDSLYCQRCCMRLLFLQIFRTSPNLSTIPAYQEWHSIYRQRKCPSRATYFPLASECRYSKRSSLVADTCCPIADPPVFYHFQLFSLILSTTNDWDLYCCTADDCDQNFKSSLRQHAVWHGCTPILRSIDRGQRSSYQKRNGTCQSH